MSNHSLWDVAHRGGEGYAPENTLASFERTMEYNIGWIEVDSEYLETGTSFFCTTKRLSAPRTARTF